MGLHHNPRIATSGLTLVLDAANPKSYPGSGATWYDISGNGSNGTVDATVVYSNDSFVFDGDNEMVTLPKIITTSDYSIEVWFTETSFTDEGWLFEQYDGGSYRLILNTDPSDQLRFFVGGTWINSGVLTLNDTYQGVAVMEGGMGYLYLNGELADSGALAYGTIDDITAAVGGSRYLTSGKQFQGSIYSVNTYNRPLLAAEVYQNFEAKRARFGI